MAAVQFAIDINIDGQAYKAARGNQVERQYTVTYVPKIKNAGMEAARQATLDPLEITTFHRGSGASRSVGINGMVSYTKNAWTCDAGILLPGPKVTAIALPAATAAPRADGIAEADGSIYAVCGQVVYKLTAGQASAPVPSVDLDMGAGKAGYALTRFGTSMFMSNNANLYERPDGGVWTAALLGSAAVQPTGALGTVWWTTGPAGATLTSPRLAAQFGTSGVRYCSSAPRLDTSWTPGLATPAIDIRGSIQRFANTLDHLYIATTSGLRDLDSSGLAPNLTPEAEDGVISTGGLAAICRGGYGYISAAYDLLRVQISGQSYAQAEPITPLLSLPNETPIGGYGVDIVTRGRYLIYATWDATGQQTWVSWGREADTGQMMGRMPGDPNAVDVVRGPELGPFIWNVAPIVTANFRVSAMWISGLASDGPRLWLFGVTVPGGVFQVRWAPLAYTTPYADLKAGRGRRFAQTCEVTMPSEDGGEDPIPKDVEEIQCESEALTGGNSIVVSGAVEGDPVFQTLCNFTSGPRTVLPVTQAIVSQRLTFKLNLNGSPLTPPILRRLSIRWLPNPDLREIRKYILQLGRYERYAHGELHGRGAMDDVHRLLDLAQAAARVTMIDEAGTAYRVRVLQVDGPAEVEADMDGSRVLSCAVTLSIFGRQPGAPFGWDAGVPYDSGRSWS